MKAKEFAVALMIMAFAMEASAAGLSVGPSKITLDDVIKGQTIEKTLVLGGDETTANATIKAEGDIKGWVSFRGAGDLTLLEDSSFMLKQGEHRIIAVFFVPKDADEGTYYGKITITSSPAAATKSGVELSLGTSISLDVAAKVTNKRIIALEVLGVSIPTTQPPGAPIPYEITLLNKGNVELNAKVKTTVLDEKKLNIISSQEDAVITGAGEEKTFKLNLTNSGLPEGVYNVNFAVETEDGPAWSSFKTLKVESTKKPDEVKKPITGEKQEGGMGVSSLWFVILLVAMVAAYAAYKRGYLTAKEKDQK